MSLSTRIALSCVLGVCFISTQEEAVAQSRLVSRLQVGAYVYFPDAHSVTMWDPLPDKAAISKTSMAEVGTTESLCVFGTPMTYGWQVQLTPVKESLGEVVVRVDWRRVRDRGQSVDAPKATVELTLAAGKSVPLDYIVPGPVSGGMRCDAIGMLLQVEVRGNGAKER